MSRRTSSPLDPVARNGDSTRIAGFRTGRTLDPSRSRGSETAHGRSDLGQCPRHCLDVLRATRISGRRRRLHRTGHSTPTPSSTAPRVTGLPRLDSRTRSPSPPTFGTHHRVTTLLARLRTVLEIDLTATIRLTDADTWKGPRADDVHRGVRAIHRLLLAAEECVARDMVRQADCPIASISPMHIRCRS